MLHQKTIDTSRPAKDSHRKSNREKGRRKNFIHFGMRAKNITCRSGERGNDLAHDTTKRKVTLLGTHLVRTRGTKKGEPSVSVRKF